MMKKGKRIFSWFLVALMIFASLPVNVFAAEQNEPEAAVSAESTTEAQTADEETTEAPLPDETVYEPGKGYIINGIRYTITAQGTVTVNGMTADMPERVDLPAYLGQYPVTKVNGFNSCTKLKEIVFPETVKSIRNFYKTGLEKIEIKGSYIEIDQLAFMGSPYYENEENWKNGLLIIDGCLIKSKAKGEVILGEEITSIAERCFDYAKECDIVRIYNPDCFIPSQTSVFPNGCQLYGRDGSTAQNYAKSFGLRFKTLCLCEDTTVVEESRTYCDGTVGYTRGVWCDRCQDWQIGHRINPVVTHFDENGDGICDYCETPLGETVFDRGIAGESAFWELNNEGTFRFYGSGALFTYLYQSYIPWNHYNNGSRIKKVVVCKGIETMMDSYFLNCKSLESVVLSDTVEKISEVFSGCTALKEVVLPASLTVIGDSCFEKCTALEEIVMPENLKIIGTSVFEGCSALEKVTFNQKLEKILDFAFKNCGKLREANLPDTVWLIERDAFLSCSALEKVKLSAELQKIGYSAFENCTALTAVTIPGKVESIGSRAFKGCTLLADVRFENGYIKLDNDIFNGTAAYNNPDNIKDGILYLDGCLIKEIVPGTVNLVLDETVTCIAVGWYNLNTKIKEITIYNPDLQYQYVSPFLPIGTVVKGTLNSTAQELAKKQGCQFILFCNCKDTVTVPESFSYCDGRVGYTEGVWCERCQLWVTGHEKKYEFSHIDENEDEICDYCRLPVEETVFDSGVCGENIRWYLTDSATMYLVGSGEMYSYDNDPKTVTPMPDWYEYAKDGKIEKVVFSDSITSVGDYAFYGCKSLKQVSASPILMSVGAYAFYNCESLSLLPLPETVYKISDCAFYGCKALSEISLSSQLTALGEFAFSGCASLKNTVIPEKITVLSVGLFSGCTSLETVDILSGATGIPEKMFEKCESLTRVSMKKKALTVGTKAFYGCKRLAAFPTDAVTSFGSYAFAGCESIREFTVNHVKAIPEGLLQNCQSLVSVSLSDTITSIGKSSFKGCISLVSLTVPETVKSVSTGAFENCKALQSIVFPETTQSIASRVFWGCEKLETVTFLNDKVTVSAPVTENNIRYLTLPETVTVIAQIGSKADTYADTYSLNFKPLTQKTIVSVVLTKEPDQTVYVRGADQTFLKSGAIITVSYEDGMTLNYQNRYTVDWKDADLEKTGVYYPELIYGEYKFPFEISVVESNSFVGVPESRAFNLYCQKGEWTSFCFVPTETRRYTLSFDNAKELEIKEGYNTPYSFGPIKYLSRVFEQGVSYNILIRSPKESRNVRITEVENIHFSLLPDGTYEAKCCFSGGDVTVPNTFGGIPVTKIADGFVYNQRTTAVKSITVSEGITEIGDNAFRDYRYSVYLPSTITKIGGNAFYGSKAVSGTLVLSENVKSVGGYAFYDCESITRLVVRSEKTTFGYKSFGLCSALETVELPANSCKLGDYMFSGCTKLQKITGAEKIRTIPTGAFYGCTALDTEKLIADAEIINGYAFYFCTQIQSVTFNDNLTQIASYAFYKCSGLEEVTLGQNVVSIGRSAFSSCNKLKKIVFNDKLKSIGEAAFCNIGITELVLPDSLETLGRQSFIGCNSLERAVLPEKITTIPVSCFSFCPSLQSVTAKGRINEVEGCGFEYCEKLTEINFWDTLTVVGSLAFKGCVLLESAPFEIIRHINNNAFEGCTSLKSVNLPDPRIFFNSEAFKGCTALTEITVPEYSTVRDRVFEDCTSLEKITVMNWVELDENVLNNCTALREIHLFTGFDTALNLGTIAENVKIYGYPGSSAEKYAAENGCEFCPVDGHVHNFTVSVSEPKRCQIPAYYVYRCDCGYYYDKKIAGTEKQHHYSDFTVDKDPTCTKPGVKSKHCFCGQTRIEVTVIEPLGHTEVIDIPAVAPTHTAPGYTHQSHCSVCGEIVVKREKIDPLEYDVEVKEDVVTAEKLDTATPEADGEHIFITFLTRNNVCASRVDKTVIYKVGEVKLSKTRLIYNGKTQKPTVVVRDSTGEALTAGRDYTVTCKDAKYPGKFSVKVDFIGNYSGSKTLSYDIVIDKIYPTFAASTTDSVTVSWKAAHPDLVYRVYYADGKGGYRKIGETKRASYTVSSLKAGNEYRFCVRAYVKDADGKVYWGELGNNVLCAANPAAVTKVSVSQGENSIRLSWSAVNGATGYRIYRYDGKWKTVKDTKSLSCEIGSLKSGTDYQFYVKPYKLTGGKTLWSTYHKNYAVKTFTRPSAVSRISASQTTTAVTLQWSPVTGADGYQVYLYNAGTKKYEVSKTVTGTSCKLTNLNPGTTCKFRIRAFKKGAATVYGAYSSEFVTATRPQTPSLRVTSASKGTASLAWTNVTGESGYQVYYATSKNGEYKKLTETKANTVNYSKKLPSGKTYYFKVRAYKKVGSQTLYGSFSAVKSIKIK